MGIFVMTFLGRSGLAIGMVLYFCSAAFAQFGPGEGRPWQFLTPNDRSVRVMQAEQLLRVQARQYQSPIYNITTNVAGDQYNCDVSATTTGNTGLVTSSGSSGAPTVMNAPSVSSDSRANESTASSGVPLNSGSSTVSSTQTTTASTVSASVTDSPIGGVTGTVYGSTNALNQSGRNDQNVQGSNLSSTISGSTACSTRVGTRR